MNINNNTAPFGSIICHQKEPLGCIAYSPYPTTDLCSKCIHGYCWPWDYVTKHFSILQKVFISQRVLLSPFIWHNKSRYLSSPKNFCLNFYKGDWEDDYLKKIQNAYQCAIFKKKMLLLCLSQKIPHTSNNTWKLSHTFSDGLTS